MLRLLREQLGDLEAGDDGGDGLPDPPILVGGLGLHVIHVHVTRPAVEPDEDDRGLLLRHPLRRRGLLRREQAGQADARHSGDPQLQEAPPAHSIAVRTR